MRVHDNRLSQAQARLEAAGYNVVIHPQCFANCTFYPQSAGTPPQKAAALHDLLANPAIDAIFCARGGNGAIHMLPFIDWALLKAHPKIIMGYSDITAFSGAALSHANMSTVHGPMAREIVSMADDELEATLSFLNTLKPQPFSTSSTWLKQEPIQGPTIGGNMAVLADLLLTPYAPKLDGAVLMLEEIDEKVHRLDRLLGALALAGTLQHLGGIILGHFTDIADSADSGMSFGKTVEEIVRHHTKAYNYGVLSHAPFGHASPNLPWVQGCEF